MIFTLCSMISKTQIASSGFNIYRTYFAVCITLAATSGFQYANHPPKTEECMRQTNKLEKTPKVAIVSIIFQNKALSKQIPIY